MRLQSSPAGRRRRPAAAWTAWDSSTGGSGPFPAAGTGCECDPASDEAFQKKLDKLSGAGVEEVHVAACVTGEKRACPRKEAILTALSARGLRVCLLEERA